jgi:hypothetical protein
MLALGVLMLDAARAITRVAVPAASPMPVMQMDS